MLIIITPPQTLPDEPHMCNALFDNGLQTLHLRKPGFSESDYVRFIENISPRYHNRVVIHDCFHLVEKFGLKGIHLSAKKQKDFVRKVEYGQVSASCHSFEDIRNLPFKVDSCFLSPVFDSISKNDYKQAFSEEEIRLGLSDISIPVMALGGINAENHWRAREMGFSGVAVLGAVWNNVDFSNIVARWRELNTPKVLSIAGFDPSSGAGVTADIKTMEATGSYGLGICSGITFQHQDDFGGVQWIDYESIEQQIETVLQKNSPTCVKIGIVENFETLNRLCNFLLEKLPTIKIIWDTVLSASSGYLFHSDLSLLNEVLRKIYLITPNTPELHRLFGEDVSETSLQEICRAFNLNILWKGGHNTGDIATDILFTKSDVTRFSVLRAGAQKHGTGCVFSAAVASFLAQGFSLQTACSQAQIYVSDFMRSASGKLGFHPKPIVPKPLLIDVKLMYITHPDPNISIARQVEMVCRGGVKLVQLRMKNVSDEELVKQAYLAKWVCDRYNALFIVNDNPLIARQVNADGVHLGKQDGSIAQARAMLGGDKIIGATCNTFADVLAAYKNGADYVGVGPCRFTETKTNLSPVLGLQGYENIVKQMKSNGIHLPVFAIGGITDNDIPDLKTCGVNGIALSSHIKDSEDIEQKTDYILRILKK